ncbi:MAG: SGNH/GDSL hydrolase family protein [Planctomycetota bacterium]
MLGLVLLDLGYGWVKPMSKAEKVQLRNFRGLVESGHAVYEGRPHTSYGLIEGREDITNALGFRGPEWERPRNPGAPRIACLGASTTEGGNGEGLEGSYPHLLEEGLRVQTGLDFEVMNCGVSGWTTAESLVSWFLTLQDFRPDVVIVHHAVNDVMPRNSPGFTPDYRHWRGTWNEPHFGPFERTLIRFSDVYARYVVKNRAPTLASMSTIRQPGELPFREHGKLPAETAHAYRRNLIAIGQSVETLGATMCLMTMPTKPPATPKAQAVFYYGIAEHNEIQRQLAAERGWLLVDAAQQFPVYPGLKPDEVFLDLVHLTRAGNTAKAALAGAELMRNWFPSWREQNP